MEQNKYGLLISPDIKLNRFYFEEMVRLLGIYTSYRSLKAGRKWTTYGEIDANYNEPITVGCIFDEHPDQKTLKKIGWVSELQENSSIIHVPYDTPGLEVGCLFYLPSGLDDGEDRLFRCVTMKNIMVYPASISCEVVPEYKSTYTPTLNNFKHGSLNLLNDEEKYH